MDTASRIGRLQRAADLLEQTRTLRHRIRNTPELSADDRAELWRQNDYLEDEMRQIMLGLLAD